MILVVNDKTLSTVHWASSFNIMGYSVIAISLFKIINLFVKLCKSVITAMSYFFHSTYWFHYWNTAWAKGKLHNLFKIDQCCTIKQLINVAISPTFIIISAQKICLCAGKTVKCWRTLLSCNCKCSCTIRMWKTGLIYESTSFCPEVLIDHSSHRISLPVLIALYFRVGGCDLRYCCGLPDCHSLHVKGHTQPSCNP